MRLIFLLFLAAVNSFASDYTEFYINNAGGGNTNSGHTADTSPTFSAQDGFWTNYTGYGVFFKAGMSLTAVTNGAWAAVYTNDSIATAFIGMITNVDDAGDFIFVQTVQSRAGTSPTQDDLNGKTHITVGGAWAGPGTYSWTVSSNTFPTALVTNTMTNSSGNITRINIKGGSDYNVTNALTLANSGPILFQGYTNSPGDLGRATIDGGATVTSYVLVNITAGGIVISDMIFSHNGTGGSSRGFQLGASGTSMAHRCRFHGMVRTGASTGGGNLFLECEADGNNTSNTGGEGGFLGSVGKFLRCISHDNTGSLSSGFVTTAAAWIDQCISYYNGQHGFNLNSSAGGSITYSIAYSNVASGIDLSKSTLGQFHIENCALFRNKAYGINSSGVALRIGNIFNSLFGSGTMTNISGNFGPNITSSQNGLFVNSSLIYSADGTPWVDPDNGNFTESPTAAFRAQGRGLFSQYQFTTTPTISYPDIGATQSASTNAASTSSASAHTFAQ